MGAGVRHASAPLDVPRLLRALRRHRVRHVLIGSTAAALHGVDLEPADLDIVPDPGSKNLRRLVRALHAVEARPKGPFGRWTTLPGGERKWVARRTTPSELAGWEPDAGNLASLDHLYVTRFGNLDVVPEVAGTYAALEARASLRSCGRVRVRVAHIDELLARLTVPRRAKDVDRVVALREIQRRMRR